MATTRKSTPKANKPKTTTTKGPKPQTQKIRVCLPSGSFMRARVWSSALASLQGLQHIDPDSPLTQNETRTAADTLHLLQAVQDRKDRLKALLKTGGGIAPAVRRDIEAVVSVCEACVGLSLLNWYEAIDDAGRIAETRRQLQVIRALRPEITRLIPILDKGIDLIWSGTPNRTSADGSGTAVKGSGQRKPRLPRAAAVAAIGTHLKENPLASSTAIEEATGLDAGYVRSLWGPLKKAMQEGKRNKPRGWKRDDGQPEGPDPSLLCTICGTPLAGSFECEHCREIVIGECKECHYTNSHTDLAMP